MRTKLMILLFFLSRARLGEALLVALVTFVVSPGRAAVTEAWAQRYNGPANGNDYATAVAVDRSGNVVVTGTSLNTNFYTDSYTAKYSATDGALLWERRSNSFANGGDAGYAVAVDANGNVVVAGTSYDGINSAYYTAKYAAANGALLWENRYNGSTNDDGAAYAVAVDSNGNVVVTGGSYGNASGEDSYTAKYAASDGSLLWEYRYNGPPNGHQSGYGVAVDGSGNVVVTGFAQGFGGDPKFYTAKHAAADGALLWEQFINNAKDDDDIYNAPSLALDGSGNVAVTGTVSNGTNYDYYTAKYAAVDGALLWERRYNGPANRDDEAYAVAVDRSGNVVVTGRSVNRSNYDFHTVKYAAANGAQLWEERHDSGDEDSASAVAVDSNDNVVVTGWSGSDFYTTKYAAADGALLWEKRYRGGGAFSLALGPDGMVAVAGGSVGSSGSSDYATVVYREYVPVTEAWVHRYNGPANSLDYAYAVAVDHSGNVVVTGESINNGTNTDYYTAKYAAVDGALLWEQLHNGAGAAVAVDSNGNVIVTGMSDRAYYTAKYAAATGALLWERRYHGPGVADAARAVALDASGNVIVTGVSYNETNSDYYTAKYAAADGALLWEQRYNGPANDEDAPNSVALDGSGNVAVTGYSYNGTNNDYYTAKYAAADGALLWERRYNGDGNGEDEATGVAVDGTGNVVVTGTSNNGEPDKGYDYYTAKYAAADGALLWERRYHGPANYDVANAVAVDANGNVAVTGHSENGGNDDYYTVKYAAADGALLWEKRYNGLANGHDDANAMAVDGSGNVVVTGSSYSGLDVFGQPTNWDYYTAKYAAADGALLWEKRYNGPGNGYDWAGPHSLALGPNGMVAVTGYSTGAGLGRLDYATVVYLEKLPSVSITRVSTGVLLRFPGVAGHSYQVLRAAAVTGPWSTNATTIAVTNGIIEYLDTKAPPGSTFYRTAVAP